MWKVWIFQNLNFKKYKFLHSNVLPHFSFLGWAHHSPVLPSSAPSLSHCQMDPTCHLNLLTPPHFPSSLSPSLLHSRRHPLTHLHGCRSNCRRALHMEASHLPLVTPSSGTAPPTRDSSLPLLSRRPLGWSPPSLPPWPTDSSRQPPVKARGELHDTWTHTCRYSLSLLPLEEHASWIATAGRAMQSPQRRWFGLPSLLRETGRKGWQRMKMTGWLGRCGLCWASAGRVCVHV
jgi:hypothetical protein